MAELQAKIAPRPCKHAIPRHLLQYSAHRGAATKQSAVTCQWGGKCPAIFNFQTFLMQPLCFTPLLRRYLWGGRRLATVLGKDLGPETAAESWELCDRHEDQSVVASGSLTGTTLGQLVRQRGPELLGRHAPQPRFPLLFKFIDARQALSVQVHPDDVRAALLQPPDLGKTEAWYVLAAEPGSVIYAGLKRGVDRAMLTREVARGTSDLCLNKFLAQPGDCYFVPAGLPHAIGAGVLVAEIQQSSDTTYRLFDFNRLGPDGQPRALHIEQALEAIDYNLTIAGPSPAKPLEQPQGERLVECEKFIFDRWTLTADTMLGEADRCHFLAVIEGSVAVACESGVLQGGLSDAGLNIVLGSGETVLLPAALGKVRVQPRGRAVLLDAYMP